MTACPRQPWEQDGKEETVAFSSRNPQHSSGNNSKGFHGPLSSSGFRGAIIQGWSSQTPYGTLSNHSQFYVFFYLPASPGWAWAFLHPAIEAGLPPQPDPELTTSLRRGPCQGDRPQEHSPETRAEWALVGLWSGQMGERGASHPPPPPPGPSDGSNTAGPGPCRLREASGKG